MAQEIRFPKLNSVILSGHLAREVELRYTPKGTPVAKFAIGFNRSYQNAEGNWIEESSFLDVRVWGKQSEICAEKLHKGSPVIVEGYISTSLFTDKENNQRKYVEIVASKVHILEKTASAGYEDSPYKPDNSPDVGQRDGGVTDDDVPF